MCKKFIDNLKDTGESGLYYTAKKINGGNSKEIECSKGRNILGKLQGKKGVKSSVDVSENVRVSSVCERKVV